MKLLRYGAPGAEKPAILDQDGRIRDLSGLTGDIDGSFLVSPGQAMRLGIDGLGVQQQRVVSA